MFSHDLHWVFPKSPAEAAEALTEKDSRLHAGGTLLIRQSGHSVKTMIDLSQAKLFGIERKHGSVSIGAAATFSDFLEFDNSASSGTSLLKNSLRYSAATPLRNRISFGGSAAAFLPWSDLWPALLCLNAGLKVLLPGGKPIETSCEEYPGSQLRRSPHLITDIVIPEDDLFWFTHRATRTTFDYPVFSLVFAAKIVNEHLSCVRIAVSGTKESVSRLRESESVLENRPLTADLLSSAVNKALPGFAEDQNFSSEYKIHWLKTVMADNFQVLLGRKK